MPTEAEVVVVGGGLAGLTAGWQLRDRDVVVLESASRPGGRIRSEKRGDYWLNFGAHVFGGAGSETHRLLKELGVPACAVPGRLAALSLGEQLITSGAVETFPFRLRLSWRERLALIRMGLRLRLAVRRYGAVCRPRAGESAAERQQRMLEFMDDRSFADFAGSLPGVVDAMFRATLTRSSGEPEDLSAGYGVGYFHLVWNRAEGLSQNILGGSGEIIRRLEEELWPRLVRRAAVTAVERAGAGVLVRWSGPDGERTIRARAAVVATPAYVTRSIVANLPEATARALEAIPYGPYVVGGILTDETGRRPWDEVYAVGTPGRAFNMLFNMTNVVRGGERGGRRDGSSFMVYAAANAARKLLPLDDAGIRERFTADLLAIYPELRGHIREVVIQRWERGLPYPRPGRSRLQADLRRPMPPVFLAGDYLGTWYSETAVQTAIEAAAGVRSCLGA